MASAAATTDSSRANLQNCPDCGREVSKRAAACPHCGAPITGVSPAINTNGTIRFKQSLTARTPNLPQAPWAPAEAESVGDGNIAAAYIISIIVPFVGFFVGIYLMAKKEPGHGVACMALSIFSFFVWYAIMN